MVASLSALNSTAPRFKQLEKRSKQVENSRSSEILNICIKARLCIKQPCSPVIVAKQGRQHDRENPQMLLTDRDAGAQHDEANVQEGALVVARAHGEFVRHAVRFV